MAFWSGIVNCSACRPTPALQGLPSSLGGSVGCCFSLSSSVAVWSSGCLFLLFSTREGGLGALPLCAVGRQPRCYCGLVVWGKFSTGVMALLSENL